MTVLQILCVVIALRWLLKAGVKDKLFLGVTGLIVYMLLPVALHLALEAVSPFAWLLWVLGGAFVVASVLTGYAVFVRQRGKLATLFGPSTTAKRTRVDRD